MWRRSGQEEEVWRHGVKWLMGARVGEEMIEDGVERSQVRVANQGVCWFCGDLVACY